MASSISFSGIASGIDSSSLIQALLDQQRQSRLKPLEDKVSSFTQTNATFKELSGLLDTLKSAADKFRTISGSALAKTVTSSSEARVSGTATGAATNGSYAVTVNSLASNNTLTFDKTFASASDTVAASISGTAPDRTVTITTGQGANQESVALEITSSTTAQQLVDSFNAASSKAEAALVNVGTSGSPSYKIAILSNNTGLELADTDVTVGAAFPSDGFGAFSESAASDASITVGGIGTVTRGSNTIGDVIAGLTLNLSATGTATVNISDDSTTSAATVQEFVDAYNEVGTFIRENNLIGQETDNRGNTNSVFGPLSSSSLDQNILDSLRQAFSGASTSGGLYNTLADLGLTTQRDGSLGFDQSKFKKAVSEDSSNVRSILENFGEDLGAVDGRIAQFTRFNGLIDQTTRLNQTQIDDLNRRIGDVNESLAKQEEALKARFSRLESLVGQLNQQSSSLASLLPR